MIRGEGHDLAAVGKSLNAIGGQKTLSVQCRDIIPSGSFSQTNWQQALPGHGSGRDNIWREGFSGSVKSENCTIKNPPDRLRWAGFFVSGRLSRLLA
jgi:hypothetical protein